MAVHVGLDIGTSAVRAAEVAVGKNPPVLLKFGQVGLPTGAVVDGDIRDPEAVSDAIRQLWRRVKFGKGKITVGVANQRVFVRQVNLPFIEPEELKEALPFQVQDFIPIPIEDTILDYIPMEDYVAEDGARMVSVVVVAGQRDMLHTVVETLAKAGLTAKAIDLTPFALLRALHAEPELLAERSRPEAILDMGAGTTSIVVHEAGTPRFIRIIATGGNTFTDAIARRMGIPAPEAEDMKMALALPMPGRIATPAPPGALESLDEVAQGYLDTIRDTISFFENQPDGAPVSRIVVTGNGARLGNLAARLAQMTNVPVEAGHPLQLLRVGKVGLPAEQLVAAEPVLPAPVGLALWGAAA